MITSKVINLMYITHQSNSLVLIIHVDGARHLLLRGRS